MNHFPNRNRLLSLTLLLMLSTAAVAVADDHAPRNDTPAVIPEDETRVALGVRAPRHVEVALLTADQLYAGQGLKADQVTIVVCGPGTKLLTKEGPLAESVQGFAAQGGRLAVCGITLQALDIDPATLLPQVEVVANGFIELLRLQTVGYFTIEL